MDALNAIKGIIDTTVREVEEYLEPVPLVYDAEPAAVFRPGRLVKGIARFDPAPALGRPNAVSVARARANDILRLLRQEQERTGKASMQVEDWFEKAPVCAWASRAGDVEKALQEALIALRASKYIAVVIPRGKRWLVKE